VTISIGVAMLQESDRASLDLIKRADEKLYEAKHAGRNRVMA
jgi:two-component system cell cycle response regulator